MRRRNHKPWDAEKRARKQAYWQEHLRTQEARARGEFDHMIDTDCIIEWIRQCKPVSELTALANERETVGRILWPNPQQDEMDAGFRMALAKDSAK